MQQPLCKITVWAEGVRRMRSDCCEAQEYAERVLYTKIQKGVADEECRNVNASGRRRFDDSRLWPDGAEYFGGLIRNPKLPRRMVQKL